MVWLWVQSVCQKLVKRVLSPVLFLCESDFFDIEPYAPMFSQIVFLDNTEYFNRPFEVAMAMAEGLVSPSDIELERADEEIRNARGFHGVQGATEETFEELFGVNGAAREYFNFRLFLRKWCTHVGVSRVGVQRLGRNGIHKFALLY